MGLDIASLLTGVSTELTADELAGGPRFLKIRKLVITDDPKRPLSVYYQSDDDKPWRPCLSMRRLLAACFGTDADSYVDQVIEVYRDDTVTYGEKGQGVQPVGGVRFKRASIEKSISLCLQAKRGKKSIWVVDPIPAAELKALFPDPSEDRVKAIVKTIGSMHVTALDSARQRASQLLAENKINANGHEQILAAIEARAIEARAAETSATPITV